MIRNYSANMVIEDFEKRIDIIGQAAYFAIIAHCSIDQRRKYTEEPYWVHPRNVAYLVSLVTDDENMIAAAWLHDVLEDVAPKNPDITADVILNIFGQDIYDMVDSLSDLSSPADGNREYRKQNEREKLEKCSDRVKTIKLADLIDNTSTIARYDPDFAKVYLKEKQLLLDVLVGGDSGLHMFAVFQCSQAQFSLYKPPSP